MKQVLTYLYEIKLMMVAKFIFWLVAFALLFTLFYAVYQSMNTKGFVLQSFEVPKKYEEAGVTGFVLANQLQDRVTELKLSINSAKQDTLNLQVDSKPDLNIQMMGLGVSGKSFVFYIRDLFGIETQAIQGELIELNHKLRLILRVTGHPPQRFETDVVPGNEFEALDFLIDRSGRHLLGQTDPYRLAVLEYQQENYPEAERLIRKMIAERPRERKWAYLAWGNLRRQQGEIENAKHHYLKSLEFDPDFELSNRVLGWQFIQESEFEKALTHFEKSLAVDPANFSSRNGMARAYFSLGNLEAAIDALETNIEYNPQKIWAYNNLTNFLLNDARDTTATIELWKRAGRNLEESADYYMARGAIYYFQNRMDSAMYCAEMALEYDPYHVPTLSQLLTFFRDEIGDLDRAYALMPQLAKGLSLGNYDLNMRVSHYNRWAMMDYENMEYDSALVHVQKAIDLDPENPFPWSTLAETYAFMGKSSEFYTYMQKAIDLGFDPRNFLDIAPYNQLKGEPQFRQLLSKLPAAVIAD